MYYRHPMEIKWGIDKAQHTYCILIRLPEVLTEIFADLLNKWALKTNKWLFDRVEWFLKKKWTSGKMCQIILETKFQISLFNVAFRLCLYKCCTISDAHHIYQLSSRLMLLLFWLYVAQSPAFFAFLHCPKNSGNLRTKRWPLAA